MCSFKTQNKSLLLKQRGNGNPLFTNKDKRDFLFFIIGFKKGLAKKQGIKNK
jgi:hypothetical protein